MLYLKLYNQSTHKFANSCRSLNSHSKTEAMHFVPTVLSKTTDRSTIGLLGVLVGLFGYFCLFPGFILCGFSSESNVNQ